MDAEEGIRAANYQQEAYYPDAEEEDRDEDEDEEDEEVRGARANRMRVKIWVPVRSRLSRHICSAVYRSLHRS